MQGRLQKINEGTGLDWSAAEAMAWGSLMYDGMQEATVNKI